MLLDDIFALREHGFVGSGPLVGDLLDLHLDLGILVGLGLLSIVLGA